MALIDVVEDALRQSGEALELTENSSKEPRYVWKSDLHSAVLEPVAKDFGDEWRLQIYANRSLVELDNLAQDLFGGLEFPILSFDIRKTFRASAPSESELVSKTRTTVLEALAWCQQLVPDDTFDMLADNYPDRPPLRQVAHVLALTRNGDFARLDDYRQNLENGHRLGFSDLVSMEFVDRCADASLGV